MLDFVLSLAPVGPPALVSSLVYNPSATYFLLITCSPHLLQTLAAVAAMASLPPDAEGQIARIITLSYAVTPAISFAVSGTLWAISKSAVGSI